MGLTATEIQITIFLNVICWLAPICPDPKGHIFKFCDIHQAYTVHAKPRKPTIID